MGLYKVVLDRLEKYIVVLTVFSFIAGILVASLSKNFVSIVNSIVSGFIDLYGYLAPLAIFIILAPSLTRLLNSNAGRFGSYAVIWLGLRRLLACLWAVVFTVIIFGFPILPNRGLALEEALMSAFSTVVRMSYTSPFLLAIWIGIITAILSVKIPRLSWLNKLLDRASTGLENAGQFFVPLIPLFMFAIGAYVYGLPDSVGDLNPNGNFMLHPINLFGLNMDPNTALGMLAIYIFGSLLIGVACFIWHFILLLIAKYKISGFSISYYFRNYWLKVYPLLWATSSEVLATPLNLYLTKKYFPGIKTVVRRFIVGMGSYLNINGTLICVFVLGGVVTSILGIRVSLLEWLLAVPIIFLLGYGVPGIPGELILFAGPIAILLNLPESITPVFLALYIGLQIGLPDSFRTGNNSTDDCVCAILLNEIYEKKYMNSTSDE